MNIDEEPGEELNDGWVVVAAGVDDDEEEEDEEEDEDDEAGDGDGDIVRPSTRVWSPVPVVLFLLTE